MSFHLYNTATRQITKFEPVVAGKASIYHCGMTVQSAPHLGHIRKEVVFDVLRRWLTVSGYEVSVVANVTDIDDKILAKSAEAGRPWFAHAYHYELELHAAYAALGCLPPTYEPRATGHIPEMIVLIDELIAAGHAYPAADGSGDVYFDVCSWPRYGELSGQKVEDMAPAEDADPRGKRDPRDFALWKGHKDGEPETAAWPSPWGRGRPGWHIECSAMATKYLGNEFDIHGGGIDLRFPHHENELAQAAAAGRPFARYWMHNSWVTAAGEKMSKSLGNYAQVTELIRKYPGRAIRLYLVAPHYRSAVEFSDTSLRESTAQLSRLDSFLERAKEVLGSADLPATDLPAAALPAAALPAEFAAAMDNDLATPAAVGVLYATVKDGNVALDKGDLSGLRQAYAAVKAMLAVLGLDPDDEIWSHRATAGQDLRPVVDGLVSALLAQRQQARSRKDYPTADAIRGTLTNLGLTIEDTPQGARWSLEK